MPSPGPGGSQSSLAGMGGELAYLAISDGAEAAANHGNCALRRASPSCGPNRAGGPKRASC
jgi:hypothetical protein